MIGVIVPEIVNHFFSSVISGIESIVEEKGYYIIFASSCESYRKEVKSIESFINLRVDGLIVCPSRETKDHTYYKKLIRNEMPLVFFDRICESINAPTVTADDTEALKTVVRHFSDIGRRRIACISGPKILSTSRNQKRGYMEGLKECGMEFYPELLVECKLSADDATIATKRLLKLREKPDAIFGVNDAVTFAAMKEIKRQGLNIPGDIALAGFTNDFHSTLVEPTLSSVTRPSFDMGKEAARLLFKWLETGKNFNDQVVLPTKFKIRNSSLPPDHPLTNTIL